MNARPLVVAMHGILSGLTSPSWPADLSHWLWQKRSSYQVIQRHYAAGPFPLLNVLFLNRFLAGYLAAELRPFVEDGAELNFVAHSNGTNVAVATIRRLARMGLRTRTAIFIGSALRSDVRRSGIESLIESGSLERAFAYCSRDDCALCVRVKWPYGDLGLRGFRRDGAPYPPAGPLSDRVHTRWFSGGHSEYFRPLRRVRTFEQIFSDLTPLPF